MTSSSLSSFLRTFRFIAALPALVLLLISSLNAQKDSGGIAGVVKDGSGALISTAKVTITDVDRGTTFSTTSNAQGEFVASPLKIGRYNVSVEKEGFKKSAVGPITVDVQERPAVEVILQVGSIAETVTVTSEGSQLETENSELGQVVNSRTISTLPLNGRNYAQLALLGAGIAPAEPGSRTEGTFGFSSNGARSLQNNYLLDGVDNNSNLGDVLNGSAYVIQPSVDALGEFKVQTNAYSAEFGRGNGAILNAVIKSGTNRFHGDVYEFLRNEALDGRNAFDQFGRQPYKQNQFGFTFGGPIIKNRTFFFGDFEGLRVRQALPQLVNIPTPAEISGDFSSFLTNIPVMATNPNTGLPSNQVALDCNGNPTYQGELFNSRLAQSGLNTAQYPNGNCGVPINGSGAPTNIIPKNLIDPLAARLAALFPAPNTSLSGNNYLSDPKKSESQNNFDIRVDHTFSDKDNFFTRFSYEDQPSFIPSPFNNALDGGNFADGYQDDSYRSVAISEVHSFRPSLINELRLGYNRINSHRLNLNYNQDVSSQLGFPGVPFNSQIGGLPSLSFSDGTVGIGSSGYLPSVEKQNSFVFNENLSWTRGRHAVKFGTEIRHEQFTIFQPASPRGSMSFGNDFTDNPEAPGTGGESVATFLLGIPDGGSITSLHNVDYRRQIYAFFAQDDFKISQRLTLNLGLRYELFTTIKEAHNEQANFDFATQSLIVPAGQNAQLTPTLAGQIPILRNGTPGLISPDLNNFAPRIGMAYQIDPKLVMRAGFGIFYGGQENGPYSNPSPGFNPPFFVTQSFNTSCTSPTANPNQPTSDCSIPGLNVLSQGFPANSLTDPNTPLLYSQDPHLRTPYTQQWHFGFEYQLPSATVLELSYAASRGQDLYGFYNGNQAVPTADATIPTAPRRPVPSIDASIATLRSNAISNYNSLQVRLQKRPTRDLQFEASYTYSHALDDASSASLGSVNNGDFQDQRFPLQEYGNADFDVRHRFVLSYAYQLPFGHGKMFGGNLSGVANQIAGNWEVAGITSASTGNHYTISDITSVFNSDCGGTVGYYCSRPNVIGNPNAHPCIAGTLFNTCAFAQNTIQGTFGTAGRNIVNGPGLQEWDISIFKTFPIREEMRFEFRAEFFNAFNHVNPLFASLGGISQEPTALEFGTSQFGYAAGAREPRNIQFALKFYF
ncbi:MAG TPA: TonB-dependent receptor [Terriglobales bacterium]|nr:TonB-dependent receptor [Terriglobales bacterium]